MSGPAESSNFRVETVRLAEKKSPLPVPIAEMPPGFFWTRTAALGFPADLTRQIDNGTLPVIYRDTVRQRMQESIDRLDAAPAGRPM